MVMVYKRGEEAPQGRGETISRNLSSTLRHTAKNEGLRIRKDGYIEVEDLVWSRKYKNLNIGLQELQWIVDGNEKKRFQLANEDGTWLIRATQGHTMKTIDSEALTTLIKDPRQIPLVLHGKAIPRFRSEVFA